MHARVHLRERQHHAEVPLGRAGAGGGHDEPELSG